MQPKLFKVFIEIEDAKEFIIRFFDDLKICLEGHSKPETGWIWQTSDK